MDKLRSQSQPAKRLTKDNKETSVVTYKQTDAKFDLRIEDIDDHELFLTQRKRPKRKLPCNRMKLNQNVDVLLSLWMKIDSLLQI